MSYDAIKHALSQASQAIARGDMAEATHLVDGCRAFGITRNDYNFLLSQSDRKDLYDFNRGGE